MSNRMGYDERYHRQNARTYGKWAARAVKNGLGHVKDADAWQKLQDDTGADVADYVTRWTERADQCFADAVQYAVRAAHNANQAQRLQLERQGK